MLPVSQDCPFLVSPSVFFNVYLFDIYGFFYSKQLDWISFDLEMYFYNGRNTA